ncbi:muts domain V-domain-containing protein [Helicostylum pulchrum]|nr:muts domain V-domain-containing protein [Helicostylum pulchrum]
MEITMCIQWKFNYLGCAYYSSHSLELLLMEDIKESDQFEYITMLIAQILPKLIILPDTSEDVLFEYFEKEHGASIEIKKMRAKDFSFDKGRYMLLNWFIHKLQLQQTMYEMNDDNQNLANRNMFMVDPEEGSRTHAYLQLEGLIHIDTSHLSIGCAGVLLKYLQKIEQEEGMDGSQNELSIQPILLRNFSCEKCMHINSDTIKSLCIFNYETHPNMHQTHGKESLSLFGLLNRTSSVLGKRLFTEWVSKPTTDKDVLDYRHESIRFFLQIDMRDIVLDLSSHLKHIKNIHQLLTKLKESKATSSDWQNILKFAYYTIRILSLLDQAYRYGSDISFMKNTRQYIPIAEVMKFVGSDIDDIIDFETSKAEGRIIVKEKVDAELELLRDKYEALDTYLLQISQEISVGLPVGLGAILNVVYFPQLGYLITLPQCRANSGDNRSTSSGISSHVGHYYARYLSGFELQFTTTENMYYKNDRMKELDETIGDIHAMIADKEIEIIQGLSERVLQHTDHFSKASTLLSELDCLLSLSLAALRFNYVEPIMTMDDSLIITQGRHPLQELCVDVFIPNDTYLQGGKGFISRKTDKLSSFYQSEYLTQPENQSASGTKRPTTLTKESNVTLEPTTEAVPVEQNTESETKTQDINSVQIVTGANFSGKSVYLKQIALIVYMAHIGSYVPAEKAIIGITDKLFTRIQTSETVSKPQSAFAFDLQQICRALNNSTNHSLVIIDEFGKGTDSSDGAALFCSVIGYFLSKCETCPKIVASTHFHDVISQDILSAQDGITLSQTEILSRQLRTEQEENDPGEEGDEVVFLYRIVPGKGPSASYGIWCAGIAGLPSSTIERAIELSEYFQNDKPIEKISTDQENYKMLKLIKNDFLEADISQIDASDLISSIESLFKM